MIYERGLITTNVPMIFLDLSVTFDTIDKNKLVEILETEMGVTGVALEWFKAIGGVRVKKSMLGLFERSL